MSCINIWFCFYRAQFADDDRTVAARDYEAACTISGYSSLSDILPMFPMSLSSESLPEYEDKVSVTSNECSLTSSSVSLTTLDTSS